MQQFAVHNKMDVPTAANTLCKYIGDDSSLIQTGCALAVSKYAQLIQADFEAGQTPDYTCDTTLKMCENPLCVLWRQWPPKDIASAFESRVKLDQSKDNELEFAQALIATDKDHHNYVKYIFAHVAHKMGLSTGDDEMIKNHTFEELVTKISSTASYLGHDVPQTQARTILNHLQGGKLGYFVRPVFDDDKDGFSTGAKLRGSDWRGKDCDDKDPNVYPGRRVRNGAKDTNCNGIPDDHEDTLCNVPQYGLMSLGDSATAHFSLPPQWVTAATIGPDTYKGVFNLLNVITDEADWPVCSSSTGHADDVSQCPSLRKDMALSSLYLKLREANRCVHRDYQNVGINGAKSASMAPLDKAGLLEGAIRNNATDFPVIAAYAVVGNDVCNKNSSVASMTSEKDFRANTLRAVYKLDSILPPGSHVLLGDLVDGRVLFEGTHDRIHPIGVTYDSLYSFLQCVKSSPCAGWMNTDASVRDATTAHAKKLSAIYPEIVQAPFQTIKVHYIPYMNIFNELVSEYKANGGDIFDLIEKTDGFHPSTTAQSLLAENIWKFIKTNLTDIVIPENPNNAKIEGLFGNQGGY